jgi:hypothetical protein
MTSGDLRCFPVSLLSNGKVVLQLRQLKSKGPFRDEQKREQIIERLRRIPGLRTTALAREGFPAIPVSSLTDSTMLNEFISTLGWIVQAIRSGAVD